MISRSSPTLQPQCRLQQCGTIQVRQRSSCHGRSVLIKNGRGRVITCAQTQVRSLLITDFVMVYHFSSSIISHLRLQSQASSCCWLAYSYQLVQWHDLVPSPSSSKNAAHHNTNSSVPISERFLLHKTVWYAMTATHHPAQPSMQLQTGYTFLNFDLKSIFCSCHAAMAPLHVADTLVHHLPAAQMSALCQAWPAL